MSISCIAWAYKQKTGNPLAKLVLIKLADNANDEGIAILPIPQIAQETELSERTVQRYIQYLSKAGLITVLPRRDGPVHLPNAYQLPVPWADTSGVTLTPGREGGGVRVTPPQKTMNSSAKSEDPPPECSNFRRDSRPAAERVSTPDQLEKLDQLDLLGEAVPFFAQVEEKPQAKEREKKESNKEKKEKEALAELLSEARPNILERKTKTLYTESTTYATYTLYTTSGERVIERGGAEGSQGSENCAPPQKARNPQTPYQFAIEEIAQLLRSKPNAPKLPDTHYYALAARLLKRARKLTGEKDPQHTPLALEFLKHEIASWSRLPAPQLPSSYQEVLRYWQAWLTGNSDKNITSELEFHFRIWISEVKSKKHRQEAQNFTQDLKAILKNAPNIIRS